MKCESWEFWSSQRLRRHFALDAETTLISGPATPKMVLASVSDGQQTYIIRPHNLAWFLSDHLPDGHMICHNIAFDFWVLNHDLVDSGQTAARNWLWSAVEDQRVHDTFLLADLVSLAQSDKIQYPSLDASCRQWLGIELPKDEYRTSFESIVGQDWGQVDQGCFGYAAPMQWLLINSTAD